MADVTDTTQRPKGYFDKICVLDTETSGINFDSIDPSKNYKMLSCGLIAADNNYNIIDELYVEFKWGDSDKHSKWSLSAQDIHGFTKEYLDKNGDTDVDGAEKIGGFLYDHWGADTPITLLGTQVATFDQFFLRNFLNNMGIPFRFSHRHLDTFGLGYGTVKAYTSDELFELCGHPRAKHNALEEDRKSVV